MTDRPVVVLATNNAKKLAELRRLVADTGAEVMVLGLGDLDPYPRTRRDRADLRGQRPAQGPRLRRGDRAAGARRRLGIAVDVLNGMPGVRSARWSGPSATDASNNALLLAQLDDVTDGERTAHFEAVVALVLPDGGEQVTTGRVDGRLLRAGVGDNGFGYDPLFVADGQSVSNGELEPAAKDRISHRGQAVRAMVPLLVAALTSGEGRP